MSIIWSIYSATVGTAFGLIAWGDADENGWMEHCDAPAVIASIPDKQERERYERIYEQRQAQNNGRK